MATRSFDLWIRRVHCVDETEHEGVWPIQGERVANDAMRLRALFLSEDSDARLVETQTGMFNLGSNYEDNTTLDMNLYLGRVLVHDTQAFPVGVNAALFLIEEDYLGDITGIEAAIKGYADTAKDVHGIASTIFGFFDKEPVMKVVSGIGKIASIVEPAIANLVLSAGNDLFPPQDISLLIRNFNDPFDDGDQRGILNFSGHGGHYQLTYEWRVGVVGRTIALQASNGSYVTAEGGGGRILHANRPHIREWETFELISLGDKVAFRSHLGQYVTAENAGRRPLMANRTHIGDWEKFELLELGDNRIALKAVNGRFVTAEDGGGRELVTNRDRENPGDWEIFTLVNM
jgi:hypothetical protein